MALSKESTIILNGAAIAGNSVSPESTGVDLSQAVDFGIGYKMAFAGTATNGARIVLYADPAGGSISFTIGAYDNPCDAEDIRVNAGKTVQGFAQMQRAPKFVRARVVNLDSSQSITNCSLWAIVQKP